MEWGLTIREYSLLRKRETLISIIDNLRRMQSEYENKIDKMKTLFEEPAQTEIIRALWWKQPFASLMLHGKIETRTYPTNVRGKVLICAGKQHYKHGEIDIISGQKVRHEINGILNTEPSFFNLPKGKAVAIGNLVDCFPFPLLGTRREHLTFVKYKEGIWCWVFENVQPIEPFEIKGKQGWKILDEETKSKIKIK